MQKKFYITTTLPYVNADPHIGFALELIQADVIARYHVLLGDTVIFNTGTDEHGVKIYRKAVEAKQSPQAYVDAYAERFRALTKLLNVSTTHFIRTTDSHHKKAAQAFWERCDTNGDIYKDTYALQYCTGCELEKTDSELVDGRCPIHPNLTIEKREEENYFFRFSKYQKKLLALYKKNPDFVVPNFRLNEIQNFVESGLHDFSISRLASKMPWGVPVPNDPTHVMFVWFDALVNYISILGWPFDSAQGKPDLFKEFWPAVQIAGKDNLRQQAAMWQAMLLSAGLAPSKQILIHGFITAKGQKISKSLGNVINPFALVEKYRVVDAVRYFLLREISPFEDGDFTYEKFEERYEADLASGLGNLVARVTKMASSEQGEQYRIQNPLLKKKIQHTKKQYTLFMDAFRFNEVLALVWELVSFCDRYIEQEKPWQEENANKKNVLGDLVVALSDIADLLEPFMPTTAEKIRAKLGKTMKDGGKIYYKPQKGESLFPRLNK